MHFIKKSFISLYEKKMLIIEENASFLILIKTCLHCCTKNWFCKMAKFIKGSDGRPIIQYLYISQYRSML